MRFAGHRGNARACEHALQRAQVPRAFSAGFSPHPKISHTGAVPTGAAGEADHLELLLAERCSPGQVRADLDTAMPEGNDVIEVVEARNPGSADRLHASEWRVEPAGVDPDDAAEAVAACSAADSVEVEGTTKKGRRRFDTRPAVVRSNVSAKSHGRGPREQHVAYAILRMVVRHTQPAVRPSDVLTGLHHVADLAPPSSLSTTRPAQGPLGEAIGAIVDPLTVDRPDAHTTSTGSTGLDVNERHENASQPSVSTTGPPG